MTDITKFTMQELMEDRSASAADSLYCQKMDPLRYHERIETNEKIVAAIDAEMARRLRTEDGFPDLVDAVRGLL